MVTAAGGSPAGVIDHDEHGGEGQAVQLLL